MKTSMLKSLLLFYLAVLCTRAQLFQLAEQSDTRRKGYTIQGVVLEQGTGQPLAGAIVSLFRSVEGGIAMSASTYDPKVATMTTATNAAASFSFTVEEAGTYHLEVRKDGYGKFGPFLRPSTTSADVTLLPDRSSEALRFELAMPGTIDGFALDAEQMKPLARLRLALWQVFYLNGQQRRIPVGTRETDQQGHFEVANLVPADYFVEVKPGLATTQRFMKVFSEDDLKQVDHDYDDKFWPGGTEYHMALPASLGSRMHLGVGRIAVATVPYYRVRVSIPPGNCESGESVTFALQGSGAWLEELGEAKCGNDVLLRGFAAGQYHIEAYIPSRSKERRVRGLAVFQIVDRNIEMALPLVPGHDLIGKVVSVSGSADPMFSQLKVSVQPVSGIPDADEMEVSPNSDGTFKLVNKQAREQRITLTGLDDYHYVKQVSYNGTDLGSDTFLINPFASIHSLEVVVDDKPASLTGVVSSGGHACDRPFVAFVKAPLTSENWPVPHVLGTGTGQYKITGLGPGDYRVIAVTISDADRFHEPGVLARMLFNAKSVTVTRGSSQSVSLELSDIR